MKKPTAIFLVFCFTTILLPHFGHASDPPILYASQHGAALNSDVYAGGGTDDTQALQAILDMALTQGRVHLVLDGAARISQSLKIHSNTTIECPDRSCGLFLSDGSNCSLLTNADWDLQTIRNRNITLIGGVYNHNSPGQMHHREEEPEMHIVSNLVFAMEFYGVEHFIMRDVTIANQRTWAMVMANWKYVNMDNIYIDRREREDHQNQDGLHFWGPGRFLTIRDIRGNAGDDFIALAPDEHDFKSSIEDVLIQGVQLEDVDQGIRLLVRGDGKLDRVVIRDVTGTYRSYGFYISPWFTGDGGHYGNIVFDHVDVRPMKNNYEYTPPFLFKIAGNIENLTLKNIYQHTPEYNHQLFYIGGHYVRNLPETDEHPNKINRLIIDGLYIDERDPNGVPDSYFQLRSDVGFLSISNVNLQRSQDIPRKGSLIRVISGTIKELRLLNVTTTGLEKLMDAKPEEIKSMKIYNVDEL